MERQQEIYNTMSVRHLVNISFYSKLKMSAFTEELTFKDGPLINALIGINWQHASLQNLIMCRHCKAVSVHVMTIKGLNY